MKLSHVNLGLLLAVMLVSTPVSAWAQGPAAENDERTYGTTSLVSHTLQAFAFTPKPFGGLVDQNELGARYCSFTTSCLFSAPVLLPAGAQVIWVQLEGCDESGTAKMIARLYQTDLVGNSFVQMAPAVDTGLATTPGCVQSTQVAFSDQIIDNLKYTYRVSVELSGSANVDFSTRFTGVRVFYRLRVHPAPATATFNDVPTNHIFFQFIEALAAAGITGGCSLNPPLYCPGDSITRGEMAVFISRALGLHFAP